MDYGTRYTDRAEKQLAARLKKVYTEAQKDLRKKVAEFTEAKKKRSAELLAKVSEGKMTMEQYREWERGQVFIGKQWQKRLNEMAQRLTDANKEAMRIIHDQQDDVFAENGNFELYQTEMHTGVSFDIYNKESVNRLIKEKPELLPRKQVNPGKDKAWNQGVIANALTQSILQGESMDEVAARLARDTASSDYKAMMRYARTAMTAAQNEGRLDALRKTEDMGIKVVKVWIAVHDSRTRDAHRELDNEEKPVEKPFENAFGKIMCPGDPTAAPGNVYNCRCALGRRYLEYQDKEENPDEVNGVPYEVWKQGKKAVTKEEEKAKMRKDAENSRKGKNPYVGELTFDEKSGILYGEKILRGVGAKSRSYPTLRNPETDAQIEYVQGSRPIYPPDHTIAGKGAKNAIRDVDRLVEKYNAPADGWQKEKARYKVYDADGDEREIEVHWYQHQDVGRVEYKIKTKNGKVYVDEW